MQQRWISIEYHRGIQHVIAFRYSVTGSTLRFAEVSMELARKYGYEAGSKWSITLVNQWPISLGSSQNSQPLLWGTFESDIINKCATKRLR